MVIPARKQKPRRHLAVSLTQGHLKKEKKKAGLEAASHRRPPFQKGNLTQGPNVPEYLLFPPKALPAWCKLKYHLRTFLSTGCPSPFCTIMFVTTQSVQVHL